MEDSQPSESEAVGKKKHWGLLCAVFALFIVATIGLVWRCSGLGKDDVTGATQEVLLVENARIGELVAQDYELLERGPGIERVKFLLRGHRISEGNGYLIVYRMFSQRSDRTDHGNMEMLTIQMDAPKVGAIYRLPSSNARVFYSRGSTVWGDGFYSSDSEGDIQVLALSPTKADVQIDLLFRPIPTDGAIRQPGVSEFKRTLSLKVSRIGDLTPWQRAQIPWPASYIPPQWIEGN